MANRFGANLSDIGLRTSFLICFGASLDIDCYNYNFYIEKHQYFIIGILNSRLQIDEFCMNNFIHLLPI